MALLVVVGAAAATSSTSVDGVIDAVVDVDDNSGDDDVAGLLRPFPAPLNSISLSDAAAFDIV